MDTTETIVYILLLGCIHFTIQMPQNMETTTQTTIVIPKNETEQACVTGKADKGVCTKRSHCDYGTPAIDYTLYAKHGYKQVCNKDEVCCPPESVIQNTEPKPVKASDEFSFSPDDSF